MARAVHCGVLQRGGTDVDPPAAGGQGDGERVGVTDAAGQLHLQVEASDDARDELAVVPAPEGRVEVDQVDPLGPLVLPTLGCQPRVAELPSRAGDALLQLDRTALGDVDGGQQFQRGGVQR